MFKKISDTITKIKKQLILSSAPNWFWVRRVNSRRGTQYYNATQKSGKIELTGRKEFQNNEPLYMYGREYKKCLIPERGWGGVYCGQGDLRWAWVRSDWLEDD